MMLNMLEKEDIVKGMSDDQLMKQAMYPDGELPQFLTVSEIQRRGKMRASYAERQPDSTVAEQIVEQSGILSNTQPNLLASSGYANPNMTQGYPQGGMPQGIPQGNMAARSGFPANIDQMSGPPVMAASGGVVNLSNGGEGRIPTLEEMRGMYDLSDAVLLMKIKEMEEEAERKRSRSLSDAYARIPQQVSAYDAALEGVRPDFIDPSKEVSFGEKFSAPNIQEGGFVIPTFAAPNYVDDSVGDASDLEEMRRNRFGQAVRMQGNISGGKNISERIRSLSEIAQNPRMPFAQRQKAYQTAQDLFESGTYGSDIIPAGIDAGGSVQGAPLSLIRQLNSGKFLAGPPLDQVVFNTEEEANAYLQELGMKEGPSAETIASEEAQGLAALLSSAQGNLTEDSRRNLESIDFKQTNPVAEFFTKKAPYMPFIHDRGEPFKNIMPEGRSKLDNLKYNLGGGAFADFLLDAQEAAAMDRSPEDQAVYDSLRQGSQDRLQAFKDDPSPWYEKLINMVKPEKLGGGAQIAGENDARAVKNQALTEGKEKDADPAVAGGQAEDKGWSLQRLDGGMPAPSGLAPQFNPFGSTASSELRALRGKSIPAPDFINPALVAFGAGVADNNLAGGLRDASKILMQQKQYEAKAAQADLDRDVKILSEAGRIDAYIRTAEAQAQKLAAAGNVDASKLIFDILDYSETRPLNERAAYVYSSMANMLERYPQLSSTIIPIMNSAKQDLQKQQAMQE